MKTYTTLLLLFLNAVLLAQNDPEPTIFTTIEPKWSMYFFDKDFVRDPRVSVYVTAYNNFQPFPFTMIDGNLYFYRKSQPYDFFGGILNKIDPSTGNIIWTYTSNYSNTDKQELNFRIQKNKEGYIQLIGVKSLNPYDPNPVIPIGSILGRMQYTYLNDIDGTLIRKDFNNDSKDSIAFTAFSRGFFNIGKNNYFSKMELVPYAFTVIPIKQDLTFGPIDSSLSLSSLKDLSNLSNSYPFSSIYQHDYESVFSLNCILGENSVGCELDKIYFDTDGKLIKTNIASDILDDVYQDNETSGGINVNEVNDDLVFFDEYFVSGGTTLDIRTWLTWKDSIGRTKVKLKNINIGSKNYRIRGPIYSSGDKLYLLGGINGDINARLGHDVLEVNLLGEIKVVGELKITHQNRSFAAIGVILSEDGNLLITALEKKYKASGEETAYWYTLYSFDAKSLGIDFVSKTKDIVTLTDDGTSLYPNPSSDKITLQFNGSTNISTIYIFDIHGKEVTKICDPTFNDRSLDIDVSHLWPSMYFVKAFDSNGKNISVKKWIKI